MLLVISSADSKSSYPTNTGARFTNILQESLSTFTEVYVSDIFFLGSSPVEPVVIECNLCPLVKLHDTFRPVLRVCSALHGMVPLSVPVSAHTDRISIQLRTLAGAMIELKPGTEVYIVLKFTRP